MNLAEVAIVGSAFAAVLGILDLKTAGRAIDSCTMFCVGNDDRKYS